MSLVCGIDFKIYSDPTTKLVWRHNQIPGVAKYEVELERPYFFIKSFNDEAESMQYFNEMCTIMSCNLIKYDK